jgi:hypothetical protein
VVSVLSGCVESGFAGVVVGAGVIGFKPFPWSAFGKVASIALLVVVVALAVA